MKKRVFPLLLLLVAGLWIAGGCAKESGKSSLTITGAGATFPYPLYSKWFYEYSNAQPGANFNYQSIGSGGGIRQITEGTVDFGATDAPMTDEEMARLPGPGLHIPTAIRGVGRKGKRRGRGNREAAPRRRRVRGARLRDAEPDDGGGTEEPGGGIRPS